MCGPTEEVLMRLIKDLGEWFDQRLQLGKPIKEAMEHPVPRSSASWAYVFGSGSLRVMILQFITGICLAFVYVPSADQAWTSLQVLNHQQSLWLVHPRLARLGFQLHGRSGADPHGAGLPVRRLQVPPRTDLDRRRFSSADDARHGVHRPGAPLRSGCLLGPWHRRFRHGPNAFHRSPARSLDAGRADHRRRNFVALLRHPRVHRSRRVDRLRRRAFAHGAQVGRE